MKTCQILSVIFALCGITLASSKKLTDEQLRVLYETPVDMEEFASNIFTLPAPQQLYLYQYLRDLLKNIEESTKMAKFVQASLKRLQQKIDDFNQENKLEKVTVKQFLLKRIYLQLNGPYKKPDAEKTTNKPSPPLDKSSPTNKPASMKNTSDSEIDSKSVSKNLKEPKSSINDSDSKVEKKSSTKKENISSPPSASKLRDEKTPPLSTSTPIARKIQPPLPTNPLNFTIRFDKPKSNEMKKLPSKSEPGSSKPIKQPSGMEENISKPLPTPTLNPSKPPKAVETATPSKKPKTQTQSQEKPANSKLSNLRQASRKMQNASSTTATESSLSFSV